MIAAGNMVRHGGGPVMKVADVFNGMVRCIMFDGRGQIRQRFYYEDQLTPLWLSLQPRSLWPDPGQLDLIEIDREEKAAKAEREKIRASKKKCRPAKASKKIKRKSAA
jgi:uncharacterized protein YodC (DUF2158 family)